MDRRSFLASAASVVGSSCFVANASDANDTWAADFARNSQSKPWTAAYAGITADLPAMQLHVRGKIPAAVHGALFRNGAARHELGGQRYHHWFDGDGMVQKYQISAAGITHHARFVRTSKFRADSAAGRPVRKAFGTHPVGAEEISSPDEINVANTSLMLNGDGELLALWEGGSAIRLTRELETLGPKVWRPDYAGMPFSAHPKVESDGTVWNFGVSSHAGMLSVYCINPNGSLRTATSMSVPELAMIHDFAVTERHLVFLLPPFVFDKGLARRGATVLDSHVWRPELGLRAMVLRKDALDKPMWFELPAGFVFHIGNAWEDDNAGAIHLDSIRSDNATAAVTVLQEVMRGNYAESSKPPHFTQVDLNLRTGAATQRELPLEVEFPRIDPRFVGMRHHSVFAAARINLGHRPGFNAVMRIDADGGMAQHFRFGDEVMVEEHVFVANPRISREGSGWLVGTALDLKQQAMLFTVFDAEHISDGPLATATMRRVMPLGLHAIHVAQA